MQKPFEQVYVSDDEVVLSTDKSREKIQCDKM